MERRTLHAWEFYPQKLNEKEMEDPLGVIVDFFDYDHLPFIREMLWEWLKITVTDGYCRTIGDRRRNDLLYFYERLQKLIEAAHILKDKRQQVVRAAAKAENGPGDAPLDFTSTAKP